MNRNEKGSALIVTMFCIMILSLCAANVAIIINQSVKESKDAYWNMKAREAAVGGMEKTLSWAASHQEDLLSIPSNISNGTLNGESYSVSCTLIANDIYLFKSEGTFITKEHVIRVYVLKHSPLEPFKFGMFSNCNIDGNGNFVLGSAGNTGDIFANGNVNLGGNSQLFGDAKAGGDAYANGDAKAGGQSLIKFPKINSTYYFDIAQKNGQIFSALPAAALTSAGYTPPGGVLWLDMKGQSLSLSGNNGKMIVNGTVVINGGDLKSTGNGEIKINPPIINGKQAPALLLFSSNADLSGNSQTINGLIYTNAGYVKVGGASTVTGAIVAFGSIGIIGNFVFNPSLGYDIQIDEQEKLLEILFWEG